MPYFLLSIALVGVDQLVKWWVRGSIPLGTSISFIPHLMDLTYTQNTGAAFSSFSGFTWLLTLVSLGASVVIAVLLGRNFFPGTWGKLSLALILGLSGLCHRYVRDHLYELRRVQRGGHLRGGGGLPDGVLCALSLGQGQGGRE